MSITRTGQAIRASDAGGAATDRLRVGGHEMARAGRSAPLVDDGLAGLRSIDAAGDLLEAAGRTASHD